METITSFNYYCPTSIDDALLLLAEKGSQAKLIAGGTDLLVMMKDRVITPESIIDIKSIPDLDQVTWGEKEGLSIGALVKVSEVIRSDQIKKRFPSLYDGAKSLGTPQLRNMATVAGNICRSSPSADLIPSLLVLDASVKLISKGGERTLLLDDFITGPGQNVLNNEILTEINIPPDNRSYRTGFIKLGRLSEDLAQVNCAVKMVITNGQFEDIKISLGAVAPRVVRARTVEAALAGEAATQEVIHEAAEMVVQDIAPITDVRSSAKYRTHVSKIVLKRLVEELINQARND